MIGQYHQLNGHEFERTPGDSEGQGGPDKESDMTQQLDNNNPLNW